jgi:PPOX class probable F420-dependent enzyme
MPKRDLSDVKTLLEGPSPAVLATYRKDGTANLSPVWFRYGGSYFEVVIADGDVKLKHISRDPRVTLLIFESTPPFRGVQVSDMAEVTHEGLDEVRRSITSRYLDDDSSTSFTEKRRGNGAVIRIPSRAAKTWDLAPITT